MKDVHWEKEIIMDPIQYDRRLERVFVTNISNFSGKEKNTLLQFCDDG